MNPSVQTAVTCAFCGTVNAVENHLDLLRGGCMLMDGRMKVVGEDPYRNLVISCGGCGHCSIDLSDDLGLPLDVLESEGYRSIVSDSSDVATVRAYAYLLSEAGRHLESSLTYLVAAWVSDSGWLWQQDVGGSGRDVSDRMRRLALAEMAGADRVGPDDAIIAADMFRCIGEHGASSGLAGMVARDPSAVYLRHIAERQLRLNEAGDTSPDVVCRRPLFYSDPREHLVDAPDLDLGTSPATIRVQDAEGYSVGDAVFLAGPDGTGRPLGIVTDVDIQGGTISVDLTADPDYRSYIISHVPTV